MLRTVRDQLHTGTEHTLHERDRRRRRLHAEVTEHTHDGPQQGIVQLHDVFVAARAQVGVPQRPGDRVPALGSHRHRRVDERAQLRQARLGVLESLLDLDVQRSIASIAIATSRSSFVEK